MAPESIPRFDTSAALTALVERPKAGGQAAAFLRQLGERMRPEDVAALVIEHCFSELQVRRAVYAGVEPEDGSLAVRFAVGFEAAVDQRVPLSADLPLVRATLEGTVITLDPGALRTCGFDLRVGGDGDPGYAAVVPLAALP